MGNSAKTPGSIRMRSNVAPRDTEDDKARAWRMVPGDLVAQFRTELLRGPNVNQRQHDEYMALTPCSICKATPYEIQINGCNRRECQKPPSETSVQSARKLREDSLSAIAVVRKNSEAATEHEIQKREALPSPDEMVDGFLRAWSPQIPTQEPHPANSKLDEFEEYEPYDYLNLALPRELVGTLTVDQARVISDASDGNTTPSDLIMLGNIFGAWIGRESWLRVADHAGFRSIRFVAAGGGDQPHSTVHLEGDDSLFIGLITNASASNEPRDSNRFLTIRSGNRHAPATELEFDILFAQWTEPGAPEWLTGHIQAIRSLLSS